MHSDGIQKLTIVQEEKEFCLVKPMQTVNSNNQMLLQIAGWIFRLFNSKLSSISIVRKCASTLKFPYPKI